MSGGEFVRFITLPQIHLAKLRASAQRLAMIAERLQSPDRTIDWPENGRHPNIGASGEERVRRIAPAKTHYNG